ncbi:MAG: hypothetical protein WCP85_23865 [Mariniphaga sp.]
MSDIYRILIENLKVRIAIYIESNYHRKADRSFIKQHCLAGGSPVKAG